MSQPPAVLRLGFVLGATPDKWARNWRERSKVRLELVPLEESEQEQALADDLVDMCLVRLPIDREGVHAVQLYDEQPVVVAGIDHFIAAADDEVSLGDLTGEQLVHPHPSGWVPTETQLDWPLMSPKDAVEVVASGTGIVILPMSVARLHHRKDTTYRPVSDLPPTTIALAWRVEYDGPLAQEMVGVVRGRTARSSRG